MSVARRAKDRPKLLTRQELYEPLSAHARDDVLLTMTEVMEGWDLTGWEVRRLVMNRQVTRLRRPGNRAYYSLSQVEAILGKPKSPFTPRYRRGFDLGELAA